MREPKNERFRRLAEARVNKIINMLRLLGNCSHSGNYEYSDEQVSQIFNRLQNELNAARARYYCAKTEKQRFSLSEEYPKNKKTDVFPSIYLDLPDGSCLQAIAFSDRNNPCIEIRSRRPSNDTEEILCHAEFNPSRNEEKRLCLCVYNSRDDEPVYYDSYFADEEDDKDEK